MDRMKVTSGQIHSIGYDQETRILEVAFLAPKSPDSVNVYQYDDVPQVIYDDLIAAKSPGSQFHRTVRTEWADKTRRIGLVPINADPGTMPPPAREPTPTTKVLETCLANLLAAGHLPDAPYEGTVELHNHGDGIPVVAELTLVVRSVKTEG